MKKTILTTLAIAMTLSSAAFAAETKLDAKKSDRVLKIAAMTNEERQGYRQEVLDNIQSYKDGLLVLKKDIATANDKRDDKAVKFISSALISLGTGATAYLSSTRITNKAGKGAGAAIAGIISIIAGTNAGFHGGIAVSAQIDMNRLQVKIDKAVEELELLQTEIEAIKDLTPKD